MQEWQNGMVLFSLQNDNTYITSKFLTLILCVKYLDEYSKTPSKYTTVGANFRKVAPTVVLF